MGVEQDDFHDGGAGLAGVAWAWMKWLMLCGDRAAVHAQSGVGGWRRVGRLALMAVALSGIIRMYGG